MKDYGPHFRTLAEKSLPESSRILVSGGGPDLLILATWLLGDANRPAKRSRLVRICISQEALEDYAAGRESVRRASDARFQDWLGARLQAFDPTHEAPLGVEPPAVTWMLDTRELNG
jgi:hypothetical protein